MINQGKVITFWSPRGNMGVTFNAINFAKRLNDIKGNTILVDLNLQFPRISDYLALEDIGHNIDNLYPYVVGNTLNKEIILSNVEDKEGLSVLKGTTNVLQAEYVKIENIAPIIHLLKDIYSYIVIDCNNLINNAGTYVALKEADVVFGLLNRDVISSMAFNDIKPLLFSNFNSDKFRFVLNKDSEKIFMQKEEMENILGIDITEALPQLNEEIINYINKGQILSVFNIKGKEMPKYSIAIDNLIKFLLPNDDVKTKTKKTILNLLRR